MKILSIRLKNLNSLLGEWHIDLQDKTYAMDGLFAVTGPTGAGKTTIFDAVCLALYGRTPRLSSVSVDSNEVMSRGTGECFAHVTFSTDEGVFTCKWGQHRSGRKSSGKLQDPVHKLEHYEPGKEEGTPITSGHKDTLKEVVRITGMDFMRFTRAMMLEQGEFDIFLTSDKKERAKVLELITGTEIYSAISRLVFARSKEEAQAFREKNIELEAVRASFGGQTEEDITAELEAKSILLGQLKASHSRTEAERDILREIRRIQIDLDRTNNDIDTQSKRLEAFEPRRIIMDMADRAASIEAEYTRLVSAREAHSRCRNDCIKLQESISQSEAKLSRLAGTIPALKEELSRIRSSTAESADTVLARVQGAARQYERAERDKLTSSEALKRANNVLNSAKAATSRRRAEGERIRDVFNEAERRLKEAYDAIKAMRARTRTAVIAEEQALLRDGEPCPVCGSREHPALIHSTEAREKSEAFFRETQRLEDEYQKLEEERNKAEDSLEAARNRWSAAYAAEQAAAQAWTSRIEELSTKTKAVTDSRDVLSEAIRPIGITCEADTGEILRRAKEWAANIRRLEEQLQTSENEVASLRTVITSAKESLEDRKAELSSLAAGLEALEAYMSGRFRQKDFSDENEFLSALQHVKELSGLRTEWQTLASSMQNLRENREAALRSLDEKKAASRTEGSYEEICALFKKQEAGIIAVSGEISALSQKLDSLRCQKARADELCRECESLKTSAERWAALNKLIGSEKGDAYRVFAQKVTLELVISNANEYLRRMNGRYTLKAKPDSEKLELSVIDREQAGEIRPTDNLSGGERFIVSLALALGLSQISGSKARVDSLFLDEGFGSLDEDALNTALEALGEVRREGRMIGIISHVAALRERIAAQIHVIPKSEGVSVLEGPGVS